MAKALYLRMQAVALHQLRPADLGAILTYAGQNIQLKYGAVISTNNDAGDTSSSRFDYVEFAIASATFSPQDLSTQASIATESSPLSYPVWQRIFVADNFVLPTPADLSVKLNSVTPTVSPAGDITLDFTVKNTGSEVASTTKVGVYLSTDAIITKADTLLGYFDPGALSGNSTRSTTATAPMSSLAPIPAGSHYIGLIVDNDNAVSESNESNNSSNAIRITSTRPSPDLKVSLSNVSPLTVASDGTLSLSVTISNAGNAEAGPQQLAFYISKDAIIDKNDFKLLWGDEPSYGANSSASFTIPGIPLDNLVPGGKYYVGAIIDNDGRIAETNEANNISNAIPITITSKGGIFTPNKDEINFNALSLDQKNSIAYGAEIYKADGGDDVVTLPKSGAVVGGAVRWAINAQFEAGLGDDTVTGGDTRDVIFGGLNLLIPALIHGFEDGNDKLYGMGGSDDLYGGGGNDILVGGKGEDKLFGGIGTDYLSGLNERSEIGVRDFLDGGGGIDNFVVDNGDTVRELEIGERLDFLTSLGIDRAIVSYDGLSLYVRVYNNLHSLMQQIKIEEGFSAQFVDCTIVPIVDPLGNAVGQGLQIVRRDGIPDVYEKFSTSPTAFRNELDSALRNVWSTIKVDGLDQVNEFAATHGWPLTERYLGQHLTSALSQAAASGAFKVLSSVNLGLKLGLVGSHLAPCVLDYYRGLIDWDEFKEKFVEALFDGLVDAFVPFSSTAGATLQVGNVILNELISKLGQAIQAPINRFLTDIGRATFGDEAYQATGEPDFIYLGPGNDKGYGQGGADFFGGGSGQGDDLYDGGTEADTVSYASTTLGCVVDLLKGTAVGVEIDTDKLISIENIFGGSGTDTITGNTFANLLAGGDGDDTIKGGAGNDTLEGDEGADRLFGEVGNDVVRGGVGNDLLYGGVGADQIDGGTGIDTASYEAVVAAIALNLAAGVGTLGDAKNDTFIDIENILGGAGADTIIGNNAANVLDGAAGNDTLGGGSGNDTLIGGLGIDTATFSGDSAGVTASLLSNTASGTASGIDTFSGIENIFGGSGNDNLTGDNGPNRLDGGGGDDVIAGGDGNDVLVGGTGGEIAGDTVSYVSATLNVTVSLALTSAQVTGGAGIDTLTLFENLTGGFGNDTLTGSIGANTLRGGDGNDVLIGGAGNDVLYGGTGSDRFKFLDLKGGHDLIADFVKGADEILIQKSGFGLSAVTDASFSSQGYVVSATGHAASAAHAQFLFDESTKQLWFDSNGTLTGGTQTLLATLTGITSLAASDFDLT